MQMSGFFMLHLYVDPEGESYEKLYGITPHAGRSRPEAYLNPAAELLVQLILPIPDHEKKY